MPRCLLVLPSEEGLAKPVARPALRGIAVPLAVVSGIALGATMALSLH